MTLPTRQPAGRALRVAALVQKRAGLAPNQRFRLEQWMPLLEHRHGIHVELLPFESPELTAMLYAPRSTAGKVRLVARDALRRWQGRRALLDADAVVVVREASLLGGAWLESWLARRRVPFVYDFDDVIWQVGRSASNGLMSLARMPWKVDRICRLASAVTVGNEFLAAYARARNPHVHIVRTSVDLDRFVVQPAPAPDAPFTIAWTGSHSTLEHLETIRPALERVGAARPTVLRVVCDREPAPFEAVRVEFVRWSPETEVSGLAGAHVGVMPLPDTEAARGKCGCKALQYMALGTPAVVAPVGINREIVHDHVNGLLATTEDEWVEALLRLAADAELRAALGARARTTVESGYSADIAAAAFAGVVRTVVATAPGAGAGRGAG